MTIANLVSPPRLRVQQEMFCNDFSQSYFIEIFYKILALAQILIEKKKHVKYLDKKRKSFNMLKLFVYF